MRSRKSPDLIQIKSSSQIPISRKPQKHSKSCSTSMLKFFSVKQKISELINEKKKVRKCIALIQEKFKESERKEDFLNGLSSSIESRLNSLEKRGQLLRIRKARLKKQNLQANIGILRDYASKFRDLDVKEKELNDLEDELNLKAEDLSFETRSSESTYSLFYVKDSFQKKVLKNSLTQIENKGESFSRYTSLSKFKKEAIFQCKSDFDEEIKKFSLEKEIFERKHATFNIFKQQVLRKKKVLDDQKQDIQNEYKIIEDIYKKNDNFIDQIKALKKDLEKHKRRINLQNYQTKVLCKEEEVLILQESLMKNSEKLKEKRRKIVDLESKLKQKCESIAQKFELQELLKEIESEINNKPPVVKDLNSTENHLLKIKSLIQKAIQKEKQISNLEKKH